MTLGPMKAQQAIAVWLLMLVGLALFAPLAASGSIPKFPACCRRGGKHHCMMSTNASSERGVPSVKETCSRSCGSTASLHTGTFRLEAHQTLDVIESGPQRELVFEKPSLQNPVFGSYRKRDPPLPLS